MRRVFILLLLLTALPASAQSVQFNVTPNLDSPGAPDTYQTYGDENISGTLTLTNGTLTATVVGSAVRGVSNDNNEGAYHFVLIDSADNATGNNDRIWDPKTTSLYLSTQTVDASEWVPPFRFLIVFDGHYYGSTYGPATSACPDGFVTLAAITPAVSGGTSLWVVGLAGFIFGWLLLSPLARK